MKCRRQLSRCNSKINFHKSFGEKFFRWLFLLTFTRKRKVLAVGIRWMGEAAPLFGNLKRIRIFLCQENFSTFFLSLVEGTVQLASLYFPLDWQFFDELKLSQHFKPLQKSRQNHWKNYANQCQLNVWQTRQNAWEFGIHRSKRSVRS